MSEQAIFVDRHNTSCVKWDMLEQSFGSRDLLGMWIADMDFRVPDCVQEALRRYMETGVYGYSYLGAGFLRAFIDWERGRHRFSVQQDWLRFSPGVVAALSWSVLSLTEPGESVLVLSPVYPQFFKVVQQSSRRLVESPLVWRGDGYGMDYGDIEKKIGEERVKLLLFCSPP
ncbi:MAG: aminotransferase class I/II-fold pyridoxal phosphate-dependent enzyme [Oscillospiraceae bacterium]